LLNRREKVARKFEVVYGEDKEQIFAMPHGKTLWLNSSYAARSKSMRFANLLLVTVNNCQNLGGSVHMKTN
jgi:hypothetical protein